MEKIRTHVNKKTGEIAYHAAVRIKGLDAHYDSFPTMAKALVWQKDTYDRLVREQREAADPRAWLPDTGQLADQKLREVLERYKEVFPKDDWRHSSAASALRVCADPTIGQLFPSWIKKYVLRGRKTMSERGKPYSWATIRLQLAVISLAIKWRAEGLDLNPPPFVVKNSAFVEACRAEGLRKEDMDNERDRRFEPGEEERLMAFLANSTKDGAEQWRLFVQFAVHTGARLQEIALAEWSELSACGEWWHIPGKHSKTKSRSMPLIDEALDVLEELRAMRKPSNKRIFHQLGTPHALSNRWAKDARKAELEGFVLHDLRHEGISQLVVSQPGIPIKALMEMVGHSSIEMFNRYAKLRPNQMNPLIRRRPKSVIEPLVAATE